MKDTLTLKEGPLREDGSREVCAPAVGRYRAPPVPGTFLAPGSGAGELRILNRTVRLLVPKGVTGVVREVLVPGGKPPVAFGEPLFLVGRALDEGGPVAETRLDANAADDGEVPEGMFAVRSPTDGIFYRRPAPEEPDYAEEGAVVARGKILGLVEVMKCFTQISYGKEPDAPERARVHRVVPPDSGEVRLGQVLFVLEAETPGVVSA